MDESYCAFCGVCFGIFSELYHGRLSDPDTEWTDYFIALRRRNTTAASDNWYLSGIGQEMAWEGYAPRPGYDARNEDYEPDGDHVVAYTNRDQNYEVVHPIHPVCWDIFLQNHALLAKENASRPDLDVLGNLLASQSLEEGDERGLKPDWTHDYLGPEQFWADGWAYHEEPEASDVAGVLDYTDEWDFLVHDPTVSLNVDELLENPPLVSGEQPPCGLRSISNQKDDFSHLPAEILLDILSFLPTSSVQALRLASRRFGSLYLNSTYWRSRFDYPNELCHIRLPATLLSRQPENSQIDWKTLCDRLLHVPETRNGGWRNRKRIALLTRRLAERVLPKDSDTHVENRIPSKITSSLTCRQFVSCPNRYSFAKASAVFSDLSPPGVIRTISVNFKPFKLASLLVGIEFVGTDDTIRLGSCTPNSTHRTDLQDGEAMKGLIVAMTMVGIVGLEFIIHVKNSPNQTRKCRFGDFEGKVALGKILSDDGSVSGINCESEKDGRIISIGLLETHPILSNTQTSETASATSTPLWYPAVPPAKLKTTSALGIRNRFDFSYMHPTIFAPDIKALCHLNRVSAFVSLEPNGIHGFQFHFDDRDPVPKKCDAQGKDIPFLIDGPGGERVFALDVIWCDQTGVVGAEIVTNHNRRSHFITADVSGDLQIARHTIPSDSFVAGIFGAVSIEDGGQSAYRSFGLFWSTGSHFTPPASMVTPADDRQFDDHFNVWTESSHLPPGCVLGEAVGSQPTHGFINWIGFDRPIKRLTVCLGAHTRNFRNDPVQLSIVGLKIDSQDSKPALLGRCTSLGSFFELDDDDCLVGFTIGITATPRSRIIREILFNTKKNLCIGFRDDQLVYSTDADGDKQVFRTIGNLCLIGFAWSFDLGPGSVGDQGIQPLYRLLDNPEVLNAAQNSLYPSIVWNHPPPPSVQLRPIPEMKSNRFDFASSLSYSDDIEKFADFNLTAIHVYYNAFIQGIMFEYKDGLARVLGNKVGAKEVFRLEDERVTTVWFRERVQKLFGMSLPREIICVDGIRFGVAKWVDGQPQQRFSPFFGCAQPFGPFINNQRGLWNSHGGGSADWISCFKPQLTRILLEPGSSFAGLYAEGLSTFIRRAGVLISKCNPLPDNVPPPPKSLEEVVCESPWLGPSPPESFKISAVAGQQTGKYRLWCYIPSGAFSAKIYRHKTSDHRLVTVGLEFFSDLENGSERNFLLGFRSLWTEYAKEVVFEDNEQITGVSFESDNHTVQGDIDILTSRRTGQTAESNNQTSNISISAPTENVVGFYAYIEEFIEGIGILYEGTST